MTIKAWDYLEEYQREKGEIGDAITSVLESGSLILGENVRAFEQRFSAYQGAHYGIGVNSGTDALFLGLRALGIGHGDEVITVANTAVPTVSAIAATGARTRFVEINPTTYLMNVERLEEAVTKKTKCILPVHLYGQCVDMETVNAVAAKHGLKVIEDCAHAHGATQSDEKAGSMSDLAAFSFYPTKILGGYGDGGMVVTSNELVAQKLRRLRFYGMEQRYCSIGEGYNSRLDELHAAILLKKLGHVDEYISRRQELARNYQTALGDRSIGLPVTANHNTHVFYLYVVRHPARDEILARLRERNILLEVSYRWPIHLMEGFQNLGYKKGDFPITEKAADEIFSLPLYPSLTDQKQMTVIAELVDIVEELK